MDRIQPFPGEKIGLCAISAFPQRFHSNNGYQYWSKNLPRVKNKKTFLCRKVSLQHIIRIQALKDCGGSKNKTKCSQLGNDTVRNRFYIQIKKKVAFVHIKTETFWNNQITQIPREEKFANRVQKTNLHDTVSDFPFLCRSGSEPGSRIQSRHFKKSFKKV